MAKKQRAQTPGESATQRGVSVIPDKPLINILAVDPGTRDLGLALMQDKRITRAWWLRGVGPLVRCKRCLSACEHARGIVIARTIEEVRLALSLGNAAAAMPDVAVIEYPKVYPGKARCDPDDLLDIAALVGGLESMLLGYSIVSYRYRPSEWKGKVPKHVHQTWILAALTVEERQQIPRSANTQRYNSDALDAVGLALWMSGRTNILPSNVSIVPRFAAEVDPPSDQYQRTRAKAKQEPLLITNKDLL